ncbi:STAS domain-containing protein [Pelagibacterium limicola]|uniref:STAS domain-containing protein n=1 Tax=Pelagibacterium limicola TaxID=2791022 RepID=UPI0018AF5EB4|nr:STAS domain-containing protein [Pelagibacterium limicola]
MPKSKPQSVSLPRVVDLDAIDDVRDTLLEALHAGPVEIVAGAVERVSTNALFMLLSAAQTAARSGTEFSISGASDALLGSIEKLGLAPSFAAVLKG